MHPVTGPQYTIEADGARAEVGALAAVLRSLTVHGGIHLTEPFGPDRLPPWGAGLVLVPFPNRVRDAVWQHEDLDQRMDVTEPSRGNAIHGLLRNTEYSLRERTDDSLTLGAVVYRQHGWPFHLDTWVRYAVDADGLTVTHGVQNLGEEEAPYALGTHPFLRVGDADIRATTITVPAASYFLVDDRLNVIGESAVDGTPADLRQPRAVGDLSLDTAYAGLDHADVRDGVGASAWLTAPDGARTTLWQGVEWGYVQVFTTDLFPKTGPGESGFGRAVAVEPMTAPPNALNSGRALRWLQPGQRWEGAWGIRYSPAPEPTADRLSADRLSADRPSADSESGG